MKGKSVVASLSRGELEIFFNDKKAGDGSLFFERKHDFLKYALSFPLAIKLTSSSILALNYLT